MNANEAILATDCTDLRRRLDVERTCNRTLNDRIRNLNALTGSQALEIERLTYALRLAQAEAAELRAGRIDASTLGY
jgi:hypothetical protein